MTYQDEAQTLAEATSAQVLAALSAYAAGSVSYEAVAALVGAFVAAGNSSAAVLGDLALAAAVTVQTGTPAAPLGVVRPADEAARLDRAARTVLDDYDTEAAVDHEAAMVKATTRLQRLAEAEIRKAVADAYSDSIGRSRQVTGWVRGLEPNACQLCQWWHRDGRVWPADHPIPRHTGCDCSQVIVTRSEPIQPVRNH